MNLAVAVSLEAVHIYTHTLCSLEDKTSIFTDALLKLFAREG